MQQSAFEYLRHGQTPFFRLPSWSPHQAGADAADVPDVAVIGVPHDGGTTYQPGARFAPYHLRRTSALVQGFHPGYGFDVFDRLRCVDGGNVAFPPFDRDEMRGSVEAEAALVARAGVTPLVVGGDHSVTLPILRALVAHHGPLAVVHVDAHLDLSGPEVWGDAFHHGTVMRHAVAEGLVAPGHLYQVGMRGPRGGADDDALARDHGGHLYDLDDVVGRGPRRVAAEVRERIGPRLTYVSVDVDAIDPAYAPGTGTPVPGGLTSREVLALLRGLAGVRVAGADVVEICPALDHADLTCHLGAHLLWELLALRAVAGPA
ncbi:MAG: agmatinase [Kofleriaceae bacterium]|nr:agmatinase [Kofleriaceae bacterium]MBP9203506.1 agmatinase [Kofleriaceae bacterium]